VNKAWACVLLTVLVLLALIALPRSCRAQVPLLIMADFYTISDLTLSMRIGANTTGGGE